MISVIHPSRGRALQALITAKNWMGKASEQVEYILSIDIDDDVELYKKAFKGLNVKILVNKNRSAVDAINNAASISTGDILIVVSDDFDCPQIWDQEIINRTKDKTDWIAKTEDGLQGWLITLPIMDRAYYNRFGYVYHPGFLHMFCDTFMSCVADLLNRKIKLPIMFKHNHYSLGHNKKDAISIRADNTWSQGEQLFIHLARQNFGLNPDEIIGKIQSVEYSSWIRNRI